MYLKKSCLGGRKAYLYPARFSGWSKNEIDVRLMNRRESNFNLCIRKPYIHERFRDRKIK